MSWRNMLQVDTHTTVGGGLGAPQWVATIALRVSGFSVLTAYGPTEAEALEALHVELVQLCDFVATLRMAATKVGS